MIAKALEKGLSLGGSRGHTALASESADAAPSLQRDPVVLARLTAQRARKFRALSTLFTLDVAQYEDAIEELLTPYETFIDCPVARGVTTGAGAEALAWVRNVESVSGLYAEHVRLFGGRDLRRQMPQVAASGGMYAAAGPADWDSELGDVYAANGFTPRQDCPCPSYIANELEFMGHLLERVAHGQTDALETARNFIVSHLYTWGIVFSAATHARSEHPVTKFAGLMLEHMLFCESRHARARDLSYRSLSAVDPT